MGVDAAAHILGIPTVTLRRALERNARRGPDGIVQARIDGVTARKFGRLWRVALDPAWAEPSLAIRRAG
jgi:hypothetical protein